MRRRGVLGADFVDGDGGVAALRAVGDEPARGRLEEEATLRATNHGSSFMQRRRDG